MFSSQFFTSITFGIIALVIVGSSWTITGLVMGDAPKRGVGIPFLETLSSSVSLVGCIIATTVLGGWGLHDCTPKVYFWTNAAYFFCGAANFFNLLWMSKAMQTGPNGVVWSIIQSALVFPFMGGIIFFGVEATPMRIIGIILLLLALVFFSMTKNNTSKGGQQWKLLAFAALAICAVQQNVQTIPSYFESCRTVPSTVRTGACALGCLFAALMCIFCTSKRDAYAAMVVQFKRKALWYYVLAMQGFSLFFSFTLTYPGMDAMAKNGLGGMAFPMMVGSCIASFTLASVLLLKEKIKPVQAIALLLCISGLVLICTKA